MMKLFFKILFIFSGSLLVVGVFMVAPAKAEYYAEGALVSVNMLAGTDEVSAFNSFTATTSLPAGTSAFVKFSQDRVNFYSSTSTKEAWDSLVDGANTVDISGLSWSGALFYYKLKLVTTVATATPEVWDAELEYTGSSATTSASTGYREGAFISANMLAGLSVTAVNTFTATTSIASGTAAYVMFSEAGDNFYSATGTANSWQALADGLNVIDLSSLGYTDGLFYKLKLTSIDAAMSPEILSVEFDYDGAEVAGESGNYSLEGYFVSANLLTGSSTFARPAYFGYSLDSLPSGTGAWVQFSNDGENWYSSTGTLWASDRLTAGSYLDRETALRLSGLDSWNNEEEFYYKLKLTTNNAYSPEISAAGLINANRFTVGNGGIKATSSILYLPFDEGYGAVAHDESGFGNDGTLYPGTAGGNTATSAMWSLSGKYGGAMEFDGVDDRVAVSDNVQYSISNTQSISQFINFQSLSTSKPLFSHWASSQYRLLIKTDDTNADEIKVCIASALTDNCTNFGKTTDADLSVNTWRHLLVAYDGNSSTNVNKLKIYLDGKEKTLAFTGTIPTAFANSNDELEIGGDADLSAYSAVKIDEVKIWNYALGEDEIKMEYNRGASLSLGAPVKASDGSTGNNAEYCVPGDTAQCDVPVLELKFEEGSGTTTYDTSGNGNDGVFVTSGSSPTWTQGKKGKGLSFDGDDDYIDFGNILSLGVYTFNFWLKTNEQNDNEGIFDFSTSDQIGSIALKDDDEVLVYLGATNYRYFQTNLANLRDGNWHSYSIYIPGGGVGSMTNGRVWVDGAELSVSGFHYGGDASSWNRFWVGDENAFGNIEAIIDDVRIYNYARTPAQIAWEYNRGKPVAEYRFDECQGTVAHDESGNGNHGTITIGSSGTQTTAGTCASSSSASAWYNGVSGKRNYSLSFDGTDDYVDIGDISLNIYSLGFWIKPDGLTDSIIDLDGGTHTITVASGVVTASGFVSPTIYIDGENKNTLDTNWHHILVKTDTAIDVNNFDIGRVSTDYFAGQIDEVKIWNYALTSEQVKMEYNGGGIMKFGQ